MKKAGGLGGAMLGGIAAILSAVVLAGGWVAVHAIEFAGRSASHDAVRSLTPKPSPHIEVPAPKVETPRLKVKSPRLRKVPETLLDQAVPKPSDIGADKARECIRKLKHHKRCF